MRDILRKWAPCPAKIRILHYITGMSLLLHIESATGVCSVALSEGGRILSLQDAGRPNAHGEKMTRLIEACMREARVELENIDAVSISAGPGSYTALRVGAATAKAICYALGKPLIRIDTLKAIAWAMRERVNERDLVYCPMIDARRMEVYAAIYDSGLSELAPAEAVIVEADTFQEWIRQGRQLVFAGDGALKCQPILSGDGKRFIEVYMSASHLAALAEEAFKAGNFEDASRFSPTYLKPPNITQPAKKWWKESG